MPESIKKIIEQIEDIPNEDENIESLEKAMVFYCSNFDICEGFKHSLILSLTDQYTNHSEDEEMNKRDLNKLLKILNII